MDKKNNRDLVISISAHDNNIKLWEINYLKCICNLEKINKIDLLFSACFLTNNNQIYILSTNCNDSNSSYPEPIKIFDLTGKKLNKIISDSNYSTFFIDTYYIEKSDKIYIITGNNYKLSSYDYYKGKLFKKY